MLDHTVIYVIHVVLDVLAKVVFGYCIVRFQFLLDKMDLKLEELRVTLADMIDDYQVYCLLELNDYQVGALLALCFRPYP